MKNKKVEEHIKRMELLRKGEKIECPYCEKGMIKKINDYAFICEKCGKGIIPRKGINL